MKFIDPVRKFIESKDQKEFFKYAVIAIGIIVALAIAIVWWSHIYIASAEEMIQDINNQREQVKKILTKHTYLEKEEREINAFIAKNPDFTILGYITQLLNQFGLTSNIPLEENISAGVGTNTYAEIISHVEIVDTDMQTVAKLFQEIEKEKRVSIKSIEITRAKPTTVTVRLEIASLRKKT